MKIVPVTSPFTTLPLIHSDLTKCIWCQIKKKVGEIEELAAQCFREKGDEYLKWRSFLLTNPSVYTSAEDLFETLNELIEAKTDFFSPRCVARHENVNPIEPYIFRELLSTGRENPYTVVVNHGHVPYATKFKKIEMNGLFVNLFTEYAFSTPDFSVHITRKITENYSYSFEFYINENQEGTLEQINSLTKHIFSKRNLNRVQIQPDTSYLATIDGIYSHLRICTMQENHFPEKVM